METKTRLHSCRKERVGNGLWSAKHWSLSISIYPWNGMKCENPRIHVDIYKQNGRYFEIMMCTVSLNIQHLCRQECLLYTPFLFHGDCTLFTNISSGEITIEQAIAPNEWIGQPFVTATDTLGLLVETTVDHPILAPLLIHITWLWVHAFKLRGFKTFVSMIYSLLEMSCETFLS